MAAPSALAASQRGVDVWSTEEYVDILRGGVPQPPDQRRGNQWSAHVEPTCLFCSRTAAQLGRANIRTHQLSCHQRPLDVVRADLVRQCLKIHRPVDMVSWSLPCPHCGVPFPSTTMRRTHVTSCLRRHQQHRQPTDRYSEQLGPEVLAERLRFFPCSGRWKLSWLVMEALRRRRSGLPSLKTSCRSWLGSQSGTTGKSESSPTSRRLRSSSAVLAERRQWQQQRPSEASSPHPSGSSQRVVCKQFFSHTTKFNEKWLPRKQQLQQER